jgi:hypothetical protein
MHTLFKLADYFYYQDKISEVNCVTTYIGESKLFNVKETLGVFSSENIKKGQYLCDINDVKSHTIVDPLIDISQVNNMNTSKELYTYLQSINFEYINSINKELVNVVIAMTDNNKYCYVARKDINKDEELYKLCGYSVCFNMLKYITNKNIAGFYKYFLSIKPRLFGRHMYDKYTDVKDIIEPLIKDKNYMDLDQYDALVKIEPTKNLFSIINDALSNKVNNNQLLGETEDEAPYDIAETQCCLLPLF